MATHAPESLIELAGQWRDLFRSARFTGIVGDEDHARRGGYHISIEDQPADNYSVVRDDDQAPPGRWRRDLASAVDMNLSFDDMVICHGRLVAVFTDRRNDPRAKYINAHNGWNGQGNAGRYDWVTGRISPATPDHKWHLHLEIRRRYADDPKAAAAVLSILRGETAAEYVGEDMNAAQFLSLLKDPKVSAELSRLAGIGVHNQRLGRSQETIGMDLQSDDNAEIMARLNQIAGQLSVIENMLLPKTEPTPESTTGADCKE